MDIGAILLQVPLSFNPYLCIHKLSMQYTHVLQPPLLQQACGVGGWLAHRSALCIGMESFVFLHMPSCAASDVLCSVESLPKTSSC